MQNKVVGNMKGCQFWVLLFTSLLFYACGAVSSAWATKKPDPLLITLSSQKVQQDERGKESLIKADKVKPGDLVQYTAIYHNRGKDVINGLKASLPIPVGMEYVGSSAIPANALASTNGQSYSPQPLMRVVKDKQGNEGKLPVPYKEYVSLRWDIASLPGGEKVKVSARMRVSQLPQLSVR